MAERILVVEDEDAMREVIVSILVSANYECRDAGDGPGALALLDSGERFDLMLTDLMMAGMDGITLLERTKGKYPDMTVVMVTSVHDVDVALKVLRMGVYEYFLVPFKSEELIAVVARALEHRRLEREHRAYVSGLESQIATLTEELRLRKL